MAKKKKKVNLYKWHILKKKLIVSIISVLCCLAIMGVGVYASTARTFRVAVQNDIDIRIAVIDGRLFAKRRGGVLKNSELSGSFVSGFKKAAGAPAPNFGTTDGSNNGFLEVYNVHTNANETLIEELETSLDINYEYNEIEYVFKYVVDTYNVGASIDDTLITLTSPQLPNTTDHPWVSIVYQYYQIPLKNANGSKGQDIEPVWGDSSWSTGANNPNDTTVMNFSGRNDAGVYTQVKIDATYPICYVRCYCKFDTNYDSDTYSSLTMNDTKDEITNGYYYGYNWRFSLKFAEQVEDNV